MKKLPILKAYLEAKYRQKWSRKKLLRYQKIREVKIRQFAMKHSAFYADLYRDGVYPIISKKEMMEHFSSLNTRGIDKEKALEFAQAEEESRRFNSMIGDVTVGLSSGTSGNRGIFLVSKQERLNWCGQMLAKTLPSSVFKKQSVGLFLRANSELYKTVQSKKIQFVFFDLQKSFDSLYDEWIQAKPDVVVAPPSVLRMLAERDIYMPKKIIACAESLDPLDADLIEKAFDQKIHQIYQCTEGFLACTCKEGRLHLNEDLVLFEKEYVSPGRFIPIITDLHRAAQPILRYRLDDVLVEDHRKCSCGCVFQTIKGIEGRCDDVLYLPTQTGELKPIFPDFIRRTVINTDKEVNNYKLMQLAPDQITLYANTGKQRLKSALENYFKKHGFTSPQITLLDQMPKRQLFEKQRRIVRKFHV